MSDTATASFTASALHGIAPLPHLGVIRAHGEDAAHFLQGQLTQDVTGLKPGQARLAALCNPKGRMLASFQVLRRADDELLLVTSADTLAATLKRLSMFVLRARLKLSDATAELALRGLLGNATTSVAAGAHQTSAGAQNDPAFTIALPAADGAPRALWLAAAGTPPPA
ncbi:MAG TPA: folate-binding protein, partial [Ottowia sp.]|nr:folate-binding protein [Ottowia sp.]